MTVISFPGICDGCGELEPNCVCTEMDNDPLCKAIKSIDLSKKLKLDDFVAELTRILNEK